MRVGRLPPNGCSRFFFSVLIVRLAHNFLVSRKKMSYQKRVNNERQKRYYHKVKDDLEQLKTEYDQLVAKVDD